MRSSLAPPRAAWRRYPSCFPRYRRVRARPVFIVLHLPRDKPSCWPGYSPANARCRCTKRRIRSRWLPEPSISRRPTIILLIDKGRRWRCRRTIRCIIRALRSTCCSNRPADVYGERLLGIILTGANEDGARGTRGSARRRRHDGGASSRRLRVAPQMAHVGAWSCGRRISCCRSEQSLSDLR